MHSLKRRARAEAWYQNDDDDVRTYSPFSRTRPTRFTAPPLQHAQPLQAQDVDSALTSLANEKPEYESVRPQRRAELASASQGEDGQSVVFESLFKRLSSRIERKVKRKRPDVSHLTVQREIKNLFFANVYFAWINVLLLLVPVGFALNYAKRSPIAIFVVNFFAIIPVAEVLNFATNEVTKFLGDVLSGLLSMSLSNFVQLISSIFLLKTRQIRVLQSSLLGSILQNLLLMLGLAFMLGGFNRMEQYFNPRVAQTIGMFLLLAVLSMTVPTVSQLWGSTSQEGILAQSRGTAVVIMVSYVLWLIFQLKTNREMFTVPDQKPSVPRNPQKDTAKALTHAGKVGMAGAVPAQLSTTLSVSIGDGRDGREEEPPPLLTLTGAVTAIIISGTILAFNTQFATDSVQGIMAEHKISDTFMGIVILPLLSNDISALKCSIQDDMDVCIALTLERCMQTALMVVPLIVLIAWGMGVDDMTLDFDGFSVAVLFAAIIIVTYVVQEGKSNWLTGALLVKVFVIIGLASFYVH